ncbi:MAG: FAD synthase [Nanoarchaeota archaeon]|nr:FAD synthase [Nanoarchaeota archaeon]MBU1004839.1 FAD synthase [Nanoarchaeota archaeon]MBU1946777.1 FAD synthase [Nanoarchaeota archaeon]
MCFGTFDILHPGHIYFLREAKRLGDYLIAVLARDSTIKEVKGITPKYDEKQRVEHIRDLRIADKVVLGYEADKYEIIEEMNPDVIALGYDQQAFADKLKEEMAKRKMEPKIVRIRSYKEEHYKSSKLR